MAPIFILILWLHTNHLSGPLWLAIRWTRETPDIERKYVFSDPFVHIKLPSWNVLRFFFSPSVLFNMLTRDMGLGKLISACVACYDVFSSRHSAIQEIRLAIQSHQQSLRFYSMPSKHMRPARLVTFRTLRGQDESSPRSHRNSGHSVLFSKLAIWIKRSIQGHRHLSDALMLSSRM